MLIWIVFHVPDFYHLSNIFQDTSYLYGYCDDDDAEKITENRQKNTQETVNWSKYDRVVDWLGNYNYVYLYKTSLGRSKRFLNLRNWYLPVDDVVARVALCSLHVQPLKKRIYMTSIRGVVWHAEYYLWCSALRWGVV